ncbi:alpha/beta hydrolase [Microbacterium sp. 22303]|uniref:alpha/beta hydrolase n=1 Tax=Microbacterium sp. 22303 TaxID=3453905 RepID=UPI003F82FE36
MIDCLAAPHSAGVIPFLAGALLLVAVAVGVLLGGIRRRRGEMSRRVVAVLLVLVLGGGGVGIGLVVAVGDGPESAARDAACLTPASGGPTRSAMTPRAISADRDVAFASGGVTYHGSYRGPVDPSNPGEEGRSVPAVVIVVGTGAVDRNGDAPTLATEAYRWLADRLSAAGVASLRYDKLGTGSTGLGAYAADPGAMIDLGYDRLRVQPIRDALAFVAAQPGVDPHRLLLLGHSEGGADALLAATDLRGAPPLAGLVLLEPAYTRILDIVARQFTVQIDAAVAGGAMTAVDAVTLEGWMARGVEQIRMQDPPFPAPEPLPLPAATGLTAVYRDTIASNIYGADPAQMVITHAYRTRYGKEYDAVDPERLAPQVAIPTLITCGTKDFNTPCGDGAPGSGVRAVSDAFRPGIAHFARLPDMVHVLRDVGSADPSTPADQLAHPFSTALQKQLGAFVAPFTEEPAP